METTWYTRELPVLAAAIQYIEDNDYERHPQAFDLAPLVGLDSKEVGKALLAMDGEYIKVSSTLAGIETTIVDEAFPSARRAVGQWPTAEMVAARLVAGLEAAVDDEPDPEKRSKLKQTAAFLGSSGKDLLINLLASVIAKGTGLG